MKNTITTSPKEEPPVEGVKNPLTEDALDKRIIDLKKTLGDFQISLDRNYSLIWVLVIGIIIVLFVGFIATLVSMLAMVNESNNFKMSAYQQLSQEVQSLQNPKKP